MKKQILIIAGPTAVGKSDIAVNVALKLGGEIISADSAQVYKYMNIGTAKITSEEMRNVPHHMLDIVNPDTDFSVAQWRRGAVVAIDDIISRQKLPIICGGTGLYINSLLNNLDFTQAVGDEAYRKELEAIAKEKGNDYLHDMLLHIDIDAYNRLFPNDLRRVIRALEVYHITGKSISYHQEQSRLLPPVYDFSYVAVGMDRSKLYSRIDMRVDIMMQRGLVNEVQGLLDMGYKKDTVAMQAIGYKEIIAYINGETTYEEAVELIKKGSRHYAKRQFTWFRNDKRVHWLNTDNYYNKEILAEEIIRATASKIEL